jgi:hypothetical protein
MVVFNKEPFETSWGNAILEGRTVGDDPHDGAARSDVGAYGVAIAPRKEDKAIFGHEAGKPFKRSVIVEGSGNARSAKVLPDPPGTWLVGEPSFNRSIDALRFGFRERRQLGGQAKFTDRALDLVPLSPHGSMLRQRPLGVKHDRRVKCGQSSGFGRFGSAWA